MQIHARSAHAAYQQGEVGSAGPLRIIILLYEGVIQSCRQGLENFDEPAVRGQALGRAHRIISELYASLDHERGQQIAASLDSLYSFVLGRLTRATVDADRAALQSSIAVLNTLLPAWRSIELRAQDGTL